MAEVRTILVTATASLLAGLVAYLVDVLTGMQRLTAYGGGAGSLLRLLVLAVIMVPIVAVVMVRGPGTRGGRGAGRAAPLDRPGSGRRQALRSGASSPGRRAPFWQVSQRRCPCLRWHKSTVALRHRPVP